MAGKYDGGSSNDPAISGQDSRDGGLICLHPSGTGVDHRVSLARKNPVRSFAYPGHPLLRNLWLLHLGTGRRFRGLKPISTHAGCALHRLYGVQPNPQRKRDDGARI